MSELRSLCGREVRSTSYRAPHECVVGVPRKAGQPPKAFARRLRLALTLLVGVPGIEPGSHDPQPCIIAFIRHPDAYRYLFVNGIIHHA